MELGWEVTGKKFRSEDGVRVKLVSSRARRRRKEVKEK